MKERPILFSAEMVRAILENRKSVTRRVIKTDHTLLDDPNILPATIEAYKTAWVKTCPYGQPGDGLWVRETFWPIGEFRYGGPRNKFWDATIRYRSDDQSDVRECPREYGIHYKNPGRWMSPRFMPRWASRITLEITGVRSERLQNITADDCMAEGISLHEIPGLGSDYSIIKAYRDLWDSLNAKRGYGWDVNPWVWCITFRRVEHAS
jgi:hypothetical protein